MKIRFAVTATAALSLAACGGQTKPAADAPDAPTSSAVSSSSAVATEAATKPAAAPAKGDKPTRDFVVGKWGTNGDCMMAIDLRADGTSDGPFGNWAYSDGVISFADEPEFKVSVTVIDNETMESTNDSSAKTSKMTRCP
jgi:hypothetical protein